MARTAKNTVTVEVGETKYEFSPQLNFNIAEVGNAKLVYLTNLGLKQRKNAAVRAKIAAEIPEVQANLKLKADMLSFGMPADKVEEFFADKKLAISTVVKLEEKDIFPASLMEAKAEEKPAEVGEDVEEEETTEEKPEPKNGKGKNKAK